MGSKRTRVVPLVGYAVLGLLAFTRKRQRHRLAEDGRPATGAFGTTRSSDEPQREQHERARQPGRGRYARAPWQIPWTGWRDILWRIREQINENRLFAVAAGVVFYGLLALFPAITALVSLYGLFASPASISEHLSTATGLLPSSAFDIVREQVNHIAQDGSAKLSLGFLCGLGLALWSANAGMKAIFDALNVVYDEKEKRDFIRLNFVSLAFTLGGILAILVAIGAVVMLPLLLGRLGLGGFGETLLQVLRWPVLLVGVILGLALLYRFGPSRTEPRWEWLSVGSIFAAFAWLASSALLSWYLSNFANYNATYGSLGAAIGLMMWMWISSIVILFGAELNSEIEHQTAKDSTVNGDKPLGDRGAVMADTVGKTAA
jgi:membrane protein